MASLITSFKYQVEIQLLIDNKSYEIPQSSITSIIPSYDYDKNTMPTIYLTLRLTTKIYNLMVTNSNKGTISFRLFKMSDDSSTSFREPYIEDNFTYYMTSNPNYNETFEQYISDSSTQDTDPAKNYLEGEIGLMSISLINSNKVFVNDIIKNSNMISIVHKYTKHMQMCLEPFDDNNTIENIIIPPVTTLTKLFSFLNSFKSFYKNGYRYFRDFQMTYLLSEKGNAVSEKSTSFSSVIIDIRDPIDMVGSLKSMEIDRTNKAYIIHVSAKDTSINADTTINNRHNQIFGVDTSGASKVIDLNIPQTPGYTEKPVLERTNSNNLNQINNSQRSMESSAITMTISKTEIDSTILTPNKTFHIRNYRSNYKYNGKYILSFKKEVMIKQGTQYIGSVMFGLRKVTE